MEASPQMLQFVGSLVAILLLALIARWLGLGRLPLLRNDAEAKAAAAKAIDGYIAVEAAVDRAGRGALLRDRDDRILVLKLHGNKFAGRLLDERASGRIDGTALAIDTGERRYGTVTMQIPDATAWVKLIDALGKGNHA